MDEMTTIGWISTTSKADCSDSIYIGWPWYNDTNNTIPLPVFERNQTENGLVNLHRPTLPLFDKYFTPLWYIIGFPGNLLAFFVWIRKRMRQSSGIYLAALALDDFIFLIMQMIFELQTVWSIDAWHVPVWCEIFPVLFYSSQYLSPLLVLAFTLERYVSIAYPYHSHLYRSKRLSIAVVASLVVFVLALHGVQAFFWHYDKNVCEVRYEVVEAGNASPFSIWSWITELLVFGLVPFLILILNILVILEVRRSNARLREQTAGASKTGAAGGGGPATHLTLLSVSFFLIFTTLPVTLCYALVLNYPYGDVCMPDALLYTDATWQSYFSYWTWRTVIQEFGMAHYACNVFVYMATGKMFRKQAIEIVPCIARRFRSTVGGASASFIRYPGETVSIRTNHTNDAHPNGGHPNGGSPNGGHPNGGPPNNRQPPIGGGKPAMTSPQTKIEEGELQALNGGCTVILAEMSPCFEKSSLISNGNATHHT